MVFHIGTFNMAIITPAPNFIREEEVRYKAAVSEATFTKMGGSINYILSRISRTVEVDMTGFYYLSAITQNGYHGLRYFNSDVNILSYYLTNVITGTAGSISINFDVFDESGNLLGDLFSVAPSISYLAGNNALIGRDVVNSNDINAGPNKVVGTLNYTTLLAGYSIKSKITGVQTNGANAFFELSYSEA
jgi:hypothetical protein